MPAEPTYVSADDLRTYTNNADLADDQIVDDTALEAKIIAAEVYIDAYAGYWERSAGVTQTRVFPRMKDTQNGITIPDAIMHATIAQVEFMYINMPDVDHGIEPDANPTSVSISPRAKQLMKGGYRRKTGKITLPYPVSPAFLNVYAQDQVINPETDIHFQSAQTQ